MEFLRHAQAIIDFLSRQPELAFLDIQLLQACLRFQLRQKGLAAPRINDGDDREEGPVAVAEPSPDSQYPATRSDAFEEKLLVRAKIGIEISPTSCERLLHDFRAACLKQVHHRVERA